MPPTEAKNDSSTLSQWTIDNGLCYVIFAYDAARSIKLEQAEHRIHEETQRQTIRHKRRAPSYFEYQPPPLRVTRDDEPTQVGKFSTRPNVDLVAYDFGAVAVIYALPIRGPFNDLLELSEELYDNEHLLAASRLHVNQLLAVIGSAAEQANLSPVVEDYVVFHIESFARPFDATHFCSAHGQQVAQILRAERQPLSDQEVDDALGTRISFGMN